MSPRVHMYETSDYNAAPESFKIDLNQNSPFA